MVQKFYTKLVRRAYRTLRHPRIRKIGWLNRLVLKFFARDLWSPHVKQIALGLSIGLFCSMLPIPFQMLLAAGICFILRGNIPLSLAGCWISNPVTQLPLMYFQERIGAAFRDSFDLNLFESLNIQGTLPLVNQTVNLANFTTGVIVTAIFMALIAHPIVYIFYFIAPSHFGKKPKQASE